MIFRYLHGLLRQFPSEILLKILTALIQSAIALDLRAKNSLGFRIPKHLHGQTEHKQGQGIVLTALPFTSFHFSCPSLLWIDTEFLHRGKGKAVEENIADCVNQSD